MSRNPDAPSPAETYALFETHEPLKAIAKRLGVSPNTLRKWWVEKFGQEAFAARGKIIQAKAATEAGHARLGITHTLTMTGESCSSCGALVQLNSIQKARLKTILCAACEETSRGADRHCPVCGFGCVGEKGLACHMARPKDGDPEAHAAYLQGQEEAFWQHKVKGQDYVRCCVCGHRGVRIDRHIQAEHDLTTEDYKFKFSGALVQADVLTAIRSEALRGCPPVAPGTKKTITCSSCGGPYDVAWSLGATRTDVRRPDLRCPDCRFEARWAGKVENEDYVVCCVCGHRAESLVSHIRSAHPTLEGHYMETFPGFLVTALNSDIRDKSAFVGRTHTPETIIKMRESAGRWNKGLTKETDSRLASGARNMMGRVVWSTGQTKETDSRLQAMAAEVARRRAATKWTSGNEVTLTREQLLPFALKNGKISVGKAMAAMGHAFVTIRRECRKYGLAISHTAVKQAICLETLAQVLNGAIYQTEWNDGTFLSPKTGRGFRFDGYFPAQKLLVEFHGYQHYTPASVWLFEEGETHEDLVWRDEEKVRQVKADGRFKLLIVREDQPFDDPVYIQQRCLDEID